MMTAILEANNKIQTQQQEMVTKLDGYQNDVSSQLEKLQTKQREIVLELDDHQESITSKLMQQKEMTSNVIQHETNLFKT